MKISIEGKHFDTDKAKKHWQILLSSDTASIEGLAKEDIEYMTADVYYSTGGEFLRAHPGTRLGTG
jgi:hypothetical protein